MKKLIYVEFYSSPKNRAHTDLQSWIETHDQKLLENHAAEDQFIADLQAITDKVNTKHKRCHNIILNQGKNPRWKRMGEPSEEEETTIEVVANCKIRLLNIQQ